MFTGGKNELNRVRQNPSTGASWPANTLGKHKHVSYAGLVPFPPVWRLQWCAGELGTRHHVGFGEI